MPTSRGVALINVGNVDGNLIRIKDSVIDLYKRSSLAKECLRKYLEKEFNVEINANPSFHHVINIKH